MYALPRIGVLLACMLFCGGAAPRLIVESCDLWSDPRMWDAVKAQRPAWEPTIGFYSSADDAVTENHIRLAVTHGIAGFQSCWYRARGNAGHDVVPIFDGFIKGVAGRARNWRDVAWNIFWDNTNPVGDPAANKDDFVDHVARFWIDRYFVRPNYLKIDGRPVIAIASARAFVRQLGSEDAARDAIARLRAGARAAGFPDVLLLTANNADPRDSNALARAIGFDAVMAYATPPFTGLLPSMDPTDAEVLRAEQSAWRLAAASSVLPAIVTASVGYDSRLWSRGTLHYMLSAPDWAQLVSDAIATARDAPAESPRRHIVLLDAWNEFGEGHFIEPTRAFGSRYLDAVLRAAISEKASDAVPGSGPVQAPKMAPPPRGAPRSVQPG